MSLTIKNIGKVSKASFREGVGIWTEGGLVDTKLKAAGGGYRKAAQFFFGKSRRGPDGKIVPTPIVETIGMSHLPWASGTVRINDTFPLEKRLVDGKPVVIFYAAIRLFQVDMTGYEKSGTETASLLKQSKGLCIGSPATDKDTGEILHSKYDPTVMIRKTVLVRVPVLASDWREFGIKDGDLVRMSTVEDTDEPGIVSAVHVKPIESQFAGSQVKKPAKGKNVTKRTRKPVVEETAAPAGVAV